MFANLVHHSGVFIPPLVLNAIFLAPLLLKKSHISIHSEFNIGSPSTPHSLNSLPSMYSSL